MASDYHGLSNSYSNAQTQLAAAKSDLLTVARDREDVEARLKVARAELEVVQTQFRKVVLERAELDASLAEARRAAIAAEARASMFATKGKDLSMRYERSKEHIATLQNSLARAQLEIVALKEKKPDEQIAELHLLVATLLRTMKVQVQEIESKLEEFKAMPALPANLQIKLN